MTSDVCQGGHWSLEPQALARLTDIPTLLAHHLAWHTWKMANRAERIILDPLKVHPFEPLTRDLMVAGIPWHWDPDTFHQSEPGVERDWPMRAGGGAVSWWWSRSQSSDCAAPVTPRLTGRCSSMFWARPALQHCTVYCVHLYCVLCCHNRYIPTGSWLQVASSTDASRFYKSQETVFLPSCWMTGTQKNPIQITAERISKNSYPCPRLWQA